MRKVLTSYSRHILFDKRCFKKYPEYEDKFFQAKLFQKNKISTPDIYSIKNLDKINLPVVIKKRISSRGKGNFLIKNHGEFVNFFKKHNRKDYIVQEYKKAEGDYRILILKNKILGTVSRRVKFNKDTTIKVKIKKSYNKIPWQATKSALKIAKILEVDFVGIDVLLSQGKHYFLEANLAPQFKGFTKVTGINVAKKIVAFLNK